jgi:hypothetical protein
MAKPHQAAEPKEKKGNMPGAPSLESVECVDVPRWHTFNFGDLSSPAILDTPLATGFECVADLCIELFIPNDNYSKIVEGTDFTVDREAGTITLLSTSSIAWGQQGGGQESWSLIAYFNGRICEVDPECKSIICCPEPLHDHSSADATASGQCSNADCPEPLITADPVSGSEINVPAYITLTSNVPEATIYYTLDGSEPDDDSEEYIEPILLENTGTIIRAIAIVEGCTPGPIANIQYSNPSFPFVFCYACDTPDNAGEWDDFTPNGNADHHWQFQFTLDANTTIARLELYQLDADGQWTNGKVWSTNSPINPFPDSPETDFASFPLLVFIAAVQQWAAYQSSLGTYGAGAHTWDLYGDKTIPASGFFRLDIILDSGTKLSQTIEAVCSASCVTCTNPSAPTLTPLCSGGIDVTFTGPVGQDFRIYMRSNVTGCGDGTWEEVDSGNIAASPTTRPIVGLTEGCLYDFYVSIDISGCGFRDSPIVSTAPLYHPTVQITSSKLSVAIGEPFTISWDSEHIGGAVCGSCPDGQVTLNHSIGCKGGNTPGSSVQSQAVCGVYTYQITGCNGCGTAIATVVVNVECACVGCDSSLVQVRLFGDPGTFLCGQFPVAPDPCFPTGFQVSTVWHGRIFRTTGCNYHFAYCSTGGSGCVFTVGGCNYPPNPLFYLGISAHCNFIGGKWILRFSAGDSAVSVPNSIFWRGEKTEGCLPTGTYVRTDGCAVGPATIRLI